MFVWLSEGLSGPFQRQNKKAKPADFVLAKSPKASSLDPWMSGFGDSAGTWKACSCYCNCVVLKSYKWMIFAALLDL